jgi:adenosylhomocysteine nucleosidase
MKLRLLVAMMLSMIGCAAQAQATPTHYKPTDTILILGAVPQEIAPFVAAMKDGQKRELWGIPYWQGRIEGKPVVVVITGIGKVYTGMTATLFIAELHPRLVLMSGTGARVNERLRTGDVIVASVMQVHDYGSLTRNDMVYRPLNGPVGGDEVENSFAPQAASLKIADAAMRATRGQK